MFNATNAGITETMDLKIYKKQPMTGITVKLNMGMLIMSVDLLAKLMNIVE